jgi:hypothetical protein
MARNKHDTDTCLYRRCDNGELVEIKLTFEQVLDRQVAGYITLKDGTEARRDIAGEKEREGATKAPRRIGTSPGWPRTSLAAGCLPKQAKEFTEQARKEGRTGIRFCPKTGDCKYSDKTEFKKYLEARGFFDNDGGYRDAQPR